jgi:hypothetical protein
VPNAEKALFDRIATTVWGQDNEHHVSQVSPTCQETIFYFQQLLSNLISNTAPLTSSLGGEIEGGQSLCAIQERYTRSNNTLAPSESFRTMDEPRNRHEILSKRIPLELAEWKTLPPMLVVLLAGAIFGIIIVFLVGMYDQERLTFHGFDELSQFGDTEHPHFLSEALPHLSLVACMVFLRYWNEPANFCLLSSV